VGQPWLGAPGGLCFHPWAAAVGRGSAPARKQDFALRCTEGVAVRHSPVLQGTKMLAPVGTAVACQCLCKLLLAPSEGLHQCGWQNRLSQAWRGFQSKSIPPHGHWHSSAPVLLPGSQQAFCNIYSLSQTWQQILDKRVQQHSACCLLV